MHALIQIRRPRATKKPNPSESRYIIEVSRASLMQVNRSHGRLSSRGRAMTMFIFPARAAGTRLVASHLAIDRPLVWGVADKRFGGIRPGRAENRLGESGKGGGGAGG